MKPFFVMLLLTALLQAGIDVRQNIKALYRGVTLSGEQKRYLLEHREEMLGITKEIALQAAGEESIHDENIVEFLLTADGGIRKFKYLVRGDKRSVDKLTRSIIGKALNCYPRPPVTTPIRLIIKYETGRDEDAIVITAKREEHGAAAPHEFHPIIIRGTTLFPEGGSEYVRVFETRRDGFVNLNADPLRCVRRVTLLTEENRKVHVGPVYRNFNTRIPKGRYKLLVQTNETCKISFQYP